MGFTRKEERPPMTQSKQEIILSRPADFMPTRILEIEIGLPLAPISAFDEQKGRSYQRAIAIVFLHDRPLGAVEFEFDHDGVSVQLAPDLLSASFTIRSM